MSNSPEFLDAADKVKNLKSSPSNDELVELYAHFKQATVGDVKTERPGMFDIKGKAKWDGWNSKKGMSKADAEKKYIEIVTDLVGKYGLK